MSQHMYCETSHLFNDVLKKKNRFQQKSVLFRTTDCKTVTIRDRVGTVIRRPESLLGAES